MTQPHIVAIGGTLRPGSSTERLLAHGLALAEARGARTTLLSGSAIDFPNYDPETAGLHPGVPALMAALRSADGVLIGSPGYHGTLSGLVKNALDHLELLGGDERAYLDGLPVGLIANAAGWQAAVSTLGTLRTVTHALRGWPTPLGVTVNTSDPGDPVVNAQAQLTIMIDQLMERLPPR